jgi:hydroxypyruvate isomerase
MRMRFSANISLLFAEVPLLERPTAAAAAGFDAVEAWWPFPDAVPAASDVDAFVGSIADSGVRLTALNLYAGDMPAGERGVVSLPDRRRQFADSLDVLVDIARRTGTAHFNALYGVRQPDATADEQDEVAVENLAAAATALQALGGTVLIEPLAVGENGAYPLTGPDDVLAVIDRVRAAGVSNLAMLADFYHLTCNGHAWKDVIDMHSDRIGHVQIADAPGRHQPGTGSIDFPALFDALAKAGYGGHVGLEYRPEGPTLESLAWLPADVRSTGIEVSAR